MKLFIVVDSVAALIPQVEIDGDASESNMGAQARLMAKMCRKLPAPLGKSDCIVLFLNQLRSKIGQMYGNPNVTTGGKSLPFFASTRTEIRSSGKIEKDEKHIGNKTKFKVVKNKMAVPYQECEIDLLFGQGFDNVMSIADACVSAGLIEKSGAWYSYKGERAGQGRDQLKEYLSSNPELLAELTAKLNGQS